MKSANLGLTLVIFSIVLSGCGSSKSMSAKAQQQKVEVKSEIAPGAPPIDDGGPTKPRIDDPQATGQENCATSEDQTLDGTTPAEFKTITLTEKAQRVQFVGKGGESYVYTQFSDISFKIERKNKEEADILEVSNRTTCTKHYKSRQSEQIAMQAMESTDVVDLNELRSIHILPIGQIHVANPDESMTLDPLKPNFLDVEFKKCQAWVEEKGVAKCNLTVTVERQTFVVSIKLSGKYHRGLVVQTN